MSSSTAKLHETRLLEAHEAIADLSAGALPPHWQAELTANTLRAYELGISIRGDGSTPALVFETYDQIEKTIEEIHQRKKSFDHRYLPDRPVLASLRNSMLRLLQAQNALRDHSAEVEDRLNPDHPLISPTGD